jgi:hypothetical protein
MKCCEHSSRKRLFKVYLIIPIILSNGDSLGPLYWRHVASRFYKKSSPGVTETLYETIVFEAKSVGIGLLQPLDLVLQDGDTVLLNRKKDSAVKRSTLAQNEIQSNESWLSVILRIRFMINK